VVYLAKMVREGPGYHLNLAGVMGGLNAEKREEIVRREGDKKNAFIKVFKKL